MNDSEASKNFNYVLEFENRNPVGYSVNVDDAIDDVVDIFMNHLNRCCPLKKVTRSKQSTDKMSFTDGLKNACREKIKPYTNYVRYPTLENEQKYENYKNKLTSMPRNSERLCYGNELDKAKLDNR